MVQEGFSHGPFTSPSYAGPKPAQTLVDQERMAQAVDPSRLSLKIGFEVPKHLL
jgi:hypothetical protein